MPFQVRLSNDDMWKQDLIPKNIYWMPGFELMDEEKKSQVEGVQLRKLREESVSFVQRLDLHSHDQET